MTVATIVSLMLLLAPLTPPERLAPKSLRECSLNQNGLCPRRRLRNVGAFAMNLGARMNLSWAAITGTVAGVNILSVDQSVLDLNSVSGANAGAGIPLIATRGTNVRLFDSPTLTGGAPGVSDCKVGALAAASWATVWNGGVSLAAVQTDMANAASQMVRVGP